MNKHLLFLLLFLVQASAWSQSISADYKKLIEGYYTDFPTIQPNDAKELINHKNVHFIDTREASEYNVSHIKGALYLSYEHPDYSVIKTIQKSDTLIVYCSIGARSQSIGEKLKAQGYVHVFNLYGGVFHWSNSNLPLVNKEGKGTTKVHGYSPEWGKWLKKGTAVYEK